MISTARSAAAVSVVKYGLPVPATKITTRPFSRWRIGAAPDVRLGDLVHRDRGHDPGRDAGPLERVLQRQAVHHGGEHADVVAGRAVHAAGRGRQAPEDVAATDDDADLDAGPWTSATWLRDERAERRVDAVWRSPSSASPDSLSRIRR